MGDPPSVPGPTSRDGPRTDDPEWALDLLARAPAPSVVLTAGGRTLAGNEAAAALFDCDVSDLADVALARVVDPAALEALAPLLEFLEGKTDRLPERVQVLARDARGRHLTVEASPLPLGRRGPLLLTLHDISDRVDAEAELRYKKALLESQNEASVDGILIVDHESEVVSMNARFVEMWGVDRELLEVGGSDEEALASVLDRLEDPDEFLETIAWLHEHPQQRTRDEVRFKDGRVFERWSTPVWGQDGTYYGRGWYFRDITERKTQEERLREAVEQLREAEQFRNQLIHTIGHDLGTPLTPVRLMLRILTNSIDDPDERQQRAIALIGRNLDQLERLVQDLKDVGHLQGGDLRVQLAPLDLRRTIEDAVGSFQASMQEQDITLELDAPDPLPVRADEGRITQVLFNLLSNARKFTPQGGEVRVQATAEDGQAVVSVTDTGRGLTEEEMDQLFQAFSQVHHHHEVDERGTGLGLFISKGLIEQHDGAVTVTSEGRGQGSTFSFRLPLRDGGRPQEPSSS